MEIMNWYVVVSEGMDKTKIESIKYIQHFFKNITSIDHVPQIRRIEGKGWKLCFNIFVGCKISPGVYPYEYVSEVL